MAKNKIYKIEPYHMGQPMKHGVVITAEYRVARAAFLRSWNSFNYGVKVSVNGHQLKLYEALMLFKPEGYHHSS